MTDRLYYTDSYSAAFDATVVAVRPAEGRTHVVLDRSAFYPTSGGQPFDTGMLESIRVVDVFENDEDHGVVHVLEHLVSGGRVPQAGDRVKGAVDWERRFDHMQQHTGQHVLSAAFDRLFGARTVSFHLGVDSSTIDLARELTAADISAAESEANRIVWENRPVSVRFVTAEEAAKLPLRKESLREGTLRLIDIEGFDLSACGGTHVARTGAIGVIAINSWERFKGGYRVEFLCGDRALKRFRTLRDSVAASVRLLSVAPEDLAGSIDRLQNEVKEQKRFLNTLNMELARHRAEGLAASAEDSPKGRLLLRVADGDANTLKTIASTITSKPGFLVVLVSATPPLLVVIARSSDVSVSASELLSALTAKFGGRGGGKPDLAQGGGLTGSRDEILTYAHNLIKG
jgi:alanyl-tRNA synthetase